MIFTGATGLLNINYFEFEFAGTFTTNYISVLNDIQLYAVPARNNVTLKLPFKLDSKKDIKLFDSKGNLVTLDEINIKQKANEYYFDLSFPKGKYFMSIKNKNSTYIKSFLSNEKSTNLINVEKKKINSEKKFLLVKR